MKRFIATISALTIATVMVTGCSTAPTSSSARSELLQDSRDTIATFKQNDRSLERFFASSAGYAVYPSIAKGGLLVGGAHGNGVLYEHGRFTNYCDISQATIGFQVGGQAYSEIIFFQNENALNEFKQGDLEFAAQATAVAVTAGAAANMNYEDGVAVFVADQRGLMAEASIGGQKFSVVSANDEAFASDTRQSQDYAVYGYANEQDPDWRSDSTYNRRYSAGQPRTIEGEIVSVGDYSPARDSQKGRQLTLRTSDGQTHVVHLGPVAYHDRSDTMPLRAGDRITVIGSSTTIENDHVIMARQIINRDNERMDLRDQDGRPRWDMNPADGSSRDSNPSSQQNRFDDRAPSSPDNSR